MHAYATDSGRGKLAVLMLAIASILLAWGFHELLIAIHLQAPWWLDTPAVLGFYGLLWKLYDQHIWRWRWKSVRISDVPDLAGEWLGQVQSSFNRTDVEARLTPLPRTRGLATSYLCTGWSLFRAVRCRKPVM